MIAAYFDMVGGASGNMIFGALVDAGADLDAIERALRTIPVEGWSIERSRVVKRGVAATHVDVVVPGEDGHPGMAAAHGRHLREILDVIAASGLSAGVKERAAAIYTKLGEAEARVHGVDIGAIHFHEVGQVDAVIDVAAACIALELLGVEQVFCSAYPLGRGHISMQHGTYPNPPPATAELMRGAPTYDSGIEAETVTTTAAAIFATLVERAGERPAMSFDKLGYGAGSRDFPIPNVLRVVIGTLTGAEAGADLQRDDVVVLEANIDDMSPQHFEVALERIVAAGALDVWLGSIAMKKSRPGILLGAIAAPADAEACARAILRETTTLGVRSRLEQRYVAERGIETVSTPLGPVRVKTARVEGNPRRSLEYDDVARIARERQRPVAEVARELERYLSTS